MLNDDYDKQLGKIVEIECVGTKLYIYALLDAPPPYNGLGVAWSLDINQDRIVTAVKPTGVVIMAHPYLTECKIEWCVPIPNRKKRLYAQKGFRL